MSTNTTNFSLIKPAVNDPTDQDLWGGYLNTNFDTIDAQLLLARDTSIGAAKVANYTIVSGDRNGLIRGDASGGAFDFDLPTASSVSSGFKITLAKIDSSTNAITIDPSGADTVDVSSLSSQYEVVSLVSDGTSHWAVAASSGAAAASDAEVLAGTEGDKFVPPKFYGDNSDISANGYIKHPSGLIEQWGSGQTESNARATVTFPLEFPTEVFSVLPVCYGVTFSGNDQGKNAEIIGTPTTTSFEVGTIDVDTNNISANISFYWMAKGK